VLQIDTRCRNEETKRRENLVKKHRHRGKRNRKTGNPICPCCEANLLDANIALDDGRLPEKAHYTEKNEILQELEIFEEMLGKYPLDQIADWFGLSRKTIRKQCRELGIHQHFPEMDRQPDVMEGSK
jgi:hypothetical protein